MNDQNRQPNTDPALAALGADLDAVGRGDRAAAAEDLESRVHAASIERLETPVPSDLVGIVAALDDLAFSEVMASDRLVDSVYAASVSALGGGAISSRSGNPLRQSFSSSNHEGVLARIGHFARARTVRIAAVAALVVAGSAVLVQVRNEQVRRAHVQELAASVDSRLNDLFTMLEASETSETVDAGETSDDALGLDEYLRSLEGRL